MDKPDKSLIKKLDKKTALLDKVPSTAHTVQHRVPFPEYVTATVRGRNVVETIMEFMRPYAKREFHLTYDNYGLEASVNYENGEFQSLILKGTGTRGERINDRLALKFVPEKSKYKGNVTLHVLLTVEWDHTRRNPGFTEREVPKMLRAALRNSQTSIDERDIVCRVMRLYLDGVRLHQDKAMDEVNPAFTPEYDIPLGYEDLEEWLQEMIVEVNLYHLPVNGLVIADESPNDPDAFPETHFIHRFHHHDQ